MLESKFQSELKREIRSLFPGCIITKLDANDIQGVPDLLILYNENWASLECKNSVKASRRPNQKYYVELMDSMSFSRFIYPENKEEVLNDLKQTFEHRRPTRISRRK